MARTPDEERRESPRAKGTADLLVGVESQTPSASIRDISLSGICFGVDEPIEFMTRLMMTLVIPQKCTSSGEPTTTVQCQGAVVRCEPIESDKDGQFEVAVFFTHLEPDAKAAIEKYVQTH